MAFQIKNYDTILTDMVTWILAHTTKLSDLTPGSIIRSYCEAASVCLEELYVAVYMGFRRHLSEIPETVFEFNRNDGQKGSTGVIFTRSGSTGVLALPLGTRVSTASGLIYRTTVASQIDDGDTSSDPVNVEATDIGTVYNVPSSSITILLDSIDTVTAVNNSNAVVNGIDVESDYAFKKRFQAYIEGLGRSNIAGLVSGALSVSGITSASVQELFPPVANVNARLYIDNGTSGGVGSAIVAEVQAVIDGDGTETNPGYRSAGVNVQVIAATVVTQNVTVAASLLAGVDGIQVVADINTAITNYINTLGVGADIIFNELIAAVMSVFGVVDCSVTLPTGNVTIAASQVARVGVITVS
jgi:uncharacterized phage protein gp47/JayE